MAEAVKEQVAAPKTEKTEKTPVLQRILAKIKSISKGIKNKILNLIPFVVVGDKKKKEETKKPDEPKTPEEKKKEEAPKKEDTPKKPEENPDSILTKMLKEHPHQGREKLLEMRKHKIANEKIDPKSAKLIELSKDNLEKAIQFAREQFYYDDYDPAQHLISSLNPKDPGCKKLLEEEKIKDNLKYWLMQDKDGKIIGITCLFEHTHKDDQENGWLGWFALDERARGSGLANKLIEKAEEEAKKRGKKRVSLYTAPQEKEEEKAQGFYEHKGYKEIKSGEPGYPPKAVDDEMREPYAELEKKSKAENKGPWIIVRSKELK